MKLAGIALAAVAVLLIALAIVLGPALTGRHPAPPAPAVSSIPAAPAPSPVPFGGTLPAYP